jgi:hypothetical protein
MWEQSEVRGRKLRRIHLDHILIAVGALGIVAALAAAVLTKV